MKAVALLLLFAFVFGRTLTYDVYLYFFKVGKVEIDIRDGKVVARGSTDPSMRWLYSYDFTFTQEGERMLLVEREKGKEKVFRDEEIYEKKPWLPLIVEYMKEGKVRESELFRVKNEGEALVVYPLKSKKVKKVVIKNGKGAPREIVIYGKAKLTLRLRDEGAD